MKRRRPISKTELIARLSPGLRPKLVRDQLTDLALVHHSNFDLIAKGKGTHQLLLDYAASVLTWSYVANALVKRELITADAVDLMTEQVLMVERMVARYGRTARIAFDGPDMQLGKDGLDVMDELARLVDRPTAVAAADWSEMRMAEMEASGEIRLREREARAA
jgi:hypothetical protein